MDLQLPIGRQNGFKRGYPSAETAEILYDQEELHRAVEAYRFFYATVSMEGVFNSGREVGLEDGKSLMVLAAGPQHVVFTANSDTPYASGVLDLQAMGPTVIDLPAGPYIGLVNDHHHGWILDMGLPGPDAGRGGRHLVLPPRFAGTIPDGYTVGQSPTYKALLALRALPLEGGDAGALDALRRVRVHPLARPSAAMSYVDVTDRALDATPLRWEDNIGYWRTLHAIVNSEPALDEHRSMYAELAALGIRRGKPFPGAPRMRDLLETAAKVAAAEMRVESFASRRPDRIVWDDRRWEWVGLVPDNASFETQGCADLEARDRWFFQAILTSPAMFRRREGSGSVYFLAARDATGAYLDGGATYRLTVPRAVPAKLFWSITAYDAAPRSQVQTAQRRAVLSSLRDTFEAGAGGDVEITLGPSAPAGDKRPWIQTAPGRGFFLYLRIYGPEAASLDGTWRPSDLLPVAAPEAREREPERPRQAPAPLASISTPDHVDSRIGPLGLTDGVPSVETAAHVYDHLDALHGIESFLGAFQAVSLQAMRRGLLDVGVQDNDVLIFSGLMDAKSLFLTANCDTVYFISFLDLGKGPLVLEAPPRVLGLLDDMWFRWISDVGQPGPDRGEGGRYLLVPPGYTGPLPEGGFFVCRSSTTRAFLLGRAFLEDGSPGPAVSRIKQHLRISPYVAGGVGSSIAAYLDARGPLDRRPAPPPPAPRFVEGTGLPMNTIPPNDFSFYELLNAAVQAEPAAAMDPEIAGQLAAIGIVKGRPFNPDARQKKVLSEAITLANASSRTLAFRPREAEGFHYYGGASAWLNPLFPGGFDFLRPPPEITADGVRPPPSPTPGARMLNARSQFFYLATGITPAMCMRLPGVGSQYVGAFTDAAGRPFDGAKTYKLRLPPDVPAALFWSLTLYDNQTRSMLDTEQRFPRAGSQRYPTAAATVGPDGATTIFFGPRRPPGAAEGNWIQTLPGKGWFVLLRLYSPLEPFFDKSWRPGEIEER